VTLFFLDRRSQLAILLAAAVTQVAAPGCGGRPGPGGPLPDGGADGYVRDAQPDYHVADPMPIDAQADHVDDPMPRDAQADYHVSDPLPWDIALRHGGERIEDLDPPPPLRAIPDEEELAAAQERAAGADELPLSRALNVRITRLPASTDLGGPLSAGDLGGPLSAGDLGGPSSAGDTVRLRALTTYQSQRLSFVWTASAGTLSTTTAGEVLWTPPAGPGRHLVQVEVRDGERALAVDAIVEVR
jgi:hypothetical protein